MTAIVLLGAARELTYHASRCVECGAEGTTDREVVVMAGAVPLEVPGLYRCLSCEGLIQSGAIKTRITPGEAQRWINKEMGPTLLMLALTETDEDDLSAISDGLTRLALAAGELDKALSGPGGEPAPAEGERAVARILALLDRAAPDGGPAVNTIRKSLRPTADGREAEYQCSRCDEWHPAELVELAIAAAAAGLLN